MTPLMAQEQVRIKIYHPAEVTLTPNLKGFSGSEMTQGSGDGDPLFLSFPAAKTNTIQDISIPIIISDNTSNASSVEELHIRSHPGYFTAEINTSTPYASFRLFISGPSRINTEEPLTIVTLKQNPLG